MTTEWLGPAGALLATLVGIIQALVVFIYTTNKKDVDRDIVVLQEQNRLQALELATLKQRVDDGARHDDRVLDRFDKLDQKLDKLSGDVVMLMRRGSGGGYSGGEMPAVRR